jgi:long-chain acyl-CoA synthetase
MKTLNDVLDQAAEKFPNKACYVTADRTMTFSELRENVLRAASGFAANGVRREACVAIVHRNSPEFVIAYFALNRIGAIAVPINFMVQKPDELAYMLNDCKSLGVVTQREFLKGLRGAAQKTPTLKRLWVTDFEGTPEKDGLEQPFSSVLGDIASLPKAQVEEGDIASILYTSGTTGNPKGVMLTHRNFVTNCDAAVRRMSLKSSDVGLCILPMFHSFAWTGNVLVSLRVGAKLVISASIAPAKPWLTLMGKHGVSLFAAVPQVYSVLAKEAQGLKGLVLKYWFFRRVRIAISGAAPLAVPVAEAFEKAFGLPILEGYGLTETSPVATINFPEGYRRGSVGKAIEGVRVKIVDDEERELPVGGEGEICIQGDNVMKGYYGLPDATRAAMTKDGWFKSGDIGALDEDGYLYIRDRKKDMIIIKGLKVFSAQVEAVLLENADVAEAAIIGIPDEHGDETIKAYFVLKPEAAADKAALMQFCRTKLDAYKRPRDIEIVSALPKNALQKVLKRELRAQELAKRSGAKAPAKAD